MPTTFKKEHRGYLIVKPSHYKGEFMTLTKDGKGGYYFAHSMDLWGFDNSVRRMEPIWCYTQKKIFKTRKSAERMLKSLNDPEAFVEDLIVEIVPYP